MIRYNLAKEEKLQQFAAANDLLNLMDREWWGGKTGAEIAIKVKLVTDETNAMIKLFVPIESKALDFVENAGVTIGIIRSEVENGTKKASDDAGKEVGWKLAEGLSPIVAVQHGLMDYAENTEGLEKSEAEVQVQVGKLVQAAKSWHAKEITAQTEAQYVDRIEQQITDYCTTQPEINIAPR